jgi:hypothetical protein
MQALQQNLRTEQTRIANLQGCRKALQDSLDALTEESKKSGDAAQDHKKINEALTKITDLIKGADPIIKAEALTGIADVLDALAAADIGQLAEIGAGTDTATQEVKCTKDAASGDNVKLDPCFITAVVSVLKGSISAGKVFLEQKPTERLAETLQKSYEIRRDLSLVQIDLERRQALQAILQQVGSAAITEASELANASLALKRFGFANAGDGGLSKLPTGAARDQASRALSGYASAWRSGRIPLELLCIRPEWIVHKSEIRRDAAMAKWNKQLIDDSLAAVHAYAQGGINIADLVDLLISSGILGVVAAG